MKTLKTTFAALALCGLAACTAPAPESVAGFIADATMNTVTLRALTSEQTYTFATAEADKSEAYGLLVGSPAIVEYTGDLKKNPEAVKISADRTYAEAVGRWTVPDPIAPAKVMGVEIVPVPLHKGERREALTRGDIDFCVAELLDRCYRILHKLLLPLVRLRTCPVSIYSLIRYNTVLSHLI